MRSPPLTTVASSVIIAMAVYVDRMASIEGHYTEVYSHESRQVHVHIIIQ